MMAVSACSSAVPPPRASQPQPVRSVATPPSGPAVAAPQVGSWTDWPITPGNWVYRQDDRGSIALFGLAGRDALVTIRCDTSRGRIYVAASTGSSPAYIAAEIVPTDSILDAVAYTRGRIALEAAGQQAIAIPVWSELPRVIDDCR
jgi:hypothetical protein